MSQKFLAILLLVTLTSITGYANTGEWTTLDAPATDSTQPRGIDGNNIVGSYDGRPFVYDGNDWTTLNSSWNGTAPFDIDGDNIVGHYYVGPGIFHGFVYDGNDWTTLDAPWAEHTSHTLARGVDSNNIVGYAGGHGFLYDGTTWTMLDMPGQSNTIAHGIDGNNIVGQFGSSNFHGFLYDGTMWTTFDMPGATSTHPYAIDGNNIVGYYEDGSGEHGFLYDGTSWTTLDMPGADWTHAMGIDGNRIVGDYLDGSGRHGFVYTMPEPVKTVGVDIKPASCFNPLNLRSNGILPVAVLGTEDFDVNDIDMASVRLAGVAPFRSNYQDITGPESDDPNACGCSDTCPDGYTDLMLKFRTPELAEALNDIYGEIFEGDELELTLTGQLHDGTPIEGLDYITIVGRVPNRLNRP